MLETGDLNSSVDMSARASKTTNEGRAGRLAQQVSLTEGYNPKAEEMGSMPDAGAVSAQSKGSVHRSEKKLVRRGSKKTGVTTNMTQTS